MEEQKFKTVISSKHKFFDLHLKETWAYRDLIMLFVKRDFIALYKQTILGPLWAVIQPLLTTIVFTLVFGSLAGLPVSDIDGLNIPSFLFYLSGTICWTYFATTLSATSNTFLKNSTIMGKVYYPRLVSPIATTITNLISFTIQFAMFIVVWVIYLCIGGYDVTVTPKLLFIPLIVLQLMILSSACGIIISSLTTKYRDLAMLVTFGLQLWQYASPVAYGLSMINRSETLSNLLWLYMLNPVTPIVTTFRCAMFGVGYFNLQYYLVSWGVTILLFILGLIKFSKIERTFMDTI